MSRPPPPPFGGAFEIETPRGIDYTINATTGEVASEKDRNGNTLTFTSDAITSNRGVQVTIERDTLGRVTALVDQMGQQTTYSYGSLGHLTSVTQPAVLSGGLMVQPVTSNSYEVYGNRTSITDANGHITTFAFDAFGHQTSRTLPAVNGTAATESNTYDSQGNITSTTDFDGNRTVYIYDYDQSGGTSLSRLVETEYFPVGPTVAQETETYIYESLAGAELYKNQGPGNAFRAPVGGPGLCREE